MIAAFLACAVFLLMPGNVHAQQAEDLKESAKTPVNRKEITVPLMTNIPLVFKYPLTSNAIRTGEPIALTVNEDVFVNGILLFKEGADAIAYIAEAKKGRSWGRGGKIEITSGQMKDVSGTAHEVTISEYVKGDSKTSAKILPIVSLVILWPLVFFAFKKGGDALIPAGKLVSGFTSTHKVVALPNSVTHGT